MLSYADIEQVSVSIEFTEYKKLYTQFTRCLMWLNMNVESGFWPAN